MTEQRLKLGEALKLLTDGELLNRISRHNADEFVAAVAIVCEAARDVEQLHAALRRLADAAVTTVTARFTDERDIPTLISAIAEARDALADVRRTEED